MSEKWSTPRNAEAVERAIKALGDNGMTVVRAKTGAEAKEKVLDLVPAGAQVFTSTSATLDAIGLAAVFNDSGEYDAVRDKLYAADGDEREKARLGAAPEWMVGSVHALTEDGSAVIASNTGSQLPGYAYSAGRVVWVVGTNKVVENLDEAMKRIYDYTLPLEAERAKKAYGIPEDQPGSFVSKLLIINREIKPERITVVLVDEALGF